MEENKFTDADKKLIQRLTERTYLTEQDETILDNIHRLYKEFYAEMKSKPKEFHINHMDLYTVQSETKLYLTGLSLADPFGNDIEIYGAEVKIDANVKIGAYYFK